MHQPPSDGKPSSSVSTPAADNASPPTAKAALAPPKDIDPFWKQPAVKKEWDLLHLSAEDEKRLGSDLQGMVMHFNRALEAGSLQQRLEDAAEPLVACDPARNSITPSPSWIPRP